MRTSLPTRRRLMSLFGRVAWLLIPVAATLGMPSVANADTNVGVGIRLADVPVASSDNPRARVYIVDHVAPGTLVKRRVEISNNTGRDTQIEVYPAAADTSHGSFVGLADRAQNELSTWDATSTAPRSGSPTGPGRWWRSRSTYLPTPRRVSSTQSSGRRRHQATRTRAGSGGSAASGSGSTSQWVRVASLLRSSRSNRSQRRATRPVTPWSGGRFAIQVVVRST